MYLAKTIVILLSAGVLVLGTYTLNILFTEGMSFSKASYKYWVTISSDAIKSFPVLGAVEDPNYYYSSGDGPSPSVQEITYISSFDKPELVQKINLFLSEQGFEKENSFFIKGNDEISVTFKKKAENLVEVSALLTSH